MGQNELTVIPLAPVVSPAEIGSLPAPVAKVPLAAPLAKGIQDLLVAFQAGSPAAKADSVRRLHIYARAIEGFPPAVAKFAVDHLLWNNPRNPFLPTPQDLRERCETVQKTWRGRVITFFTGRSSEWCTMFELKAEIAWGPAPLTDDCLIPRSLVVEWLRAWTEDIANAERIAELSSERLSAFPEDGIAPGTQDRITAARKAKRENKQQQLEKELGQMHWLRQRKDRSHVMPSKEQIAAEARQMVEKSERG